MIRGAVRIERRVATLARLKKRNEKYLMWEKGGITSRGGAEWHELYER